jgi:L-alanine-DL-glutamate epimerase-like enolase superfamily enzyme
VPRKRIPILRLDSAAYRIPTDAPEADGTFEWSATTMVVVHAHAAGEVGLGYSYTHASAVTLINDVLAPCVTGVAAFDVATAWSRMLRAVRNIGRPGLCATAISAVDAALWELKARLIDVPLVDLLGAARDSAPVYGSGGFTSYDEERLARQLTEWTERGVKQVKMKIGAHPDQDLARVRAVRRHLGPEPKLFVDANGAYDPKQALAVAEALAAEGVVWFEEPVSSDDLEGLRLVRERAPAGMDIAAGEYGYDAFYFRRMLEARAVDVLQADATRCCGVTGFLQADALADAHHLPLSSHCAPALHAAVCCASKRLKHMEYFYDHARIEAMLFEGAPQVVDGRLSAQRERPGCGFTFRGRDAERYRL